MNALQTIRSAALTVLILGTPSLHAGDDCERPTAEWQSRRAVEQFAQRSGWQIDKLKIDDGCYEIKGRDAEGYRFEVKLDPATLEIVGMKREHQRRDRDRTRARAAGENQSNPGELE